MDTCLGNFIPTEADAKRFFEVLRQDPKCRELFDELVRVHLESITIDDVVDLDDIRHLDEDDLSIRVAENAQSSPAIDIFLYDLSELLWPWLSACTREENELNNFWDELMSAPQESGWIGHYTELVEHILAELRAIAESKSNGHDADLGQVCRQVLSRLREDKLNDSLQCTADGFVLAMIDFVVSTFRWWDNARSL